MKRARWREGFGLPVLLLSAMLSTTVTPAAMSAGLLPAIGRGADCASVTPAVAGRAATDAGPGAGFARVTAQLARKGDLTGRTLSGRAANGAPISVALPVESYVAPPDGSVVLFTRSSSETGSEVRAIDLNSGCDIKLAAPSEIVRSAILDSSGVQVYVHSVTRGGRADAGVTRIDLGSGAAALAVPPLRPSDDIGPIFGTELHWSVDGSHLAVQSCGFSQCLTRVLDVASGVLSTFDADNQGAFIGLTADHLLTYGDCLGLPSDVASTDLATGRVSLLATGASSASLEGRSDGHALVTIETDGGSKDVLQ
jgi:hypothetical protein